MSYQLLIIGEGLKDIGLPQRKFDFAFLLVVAHNKVFDLTIGLVSDISELIHKCLPYLISPQ